MAFFRHAHKEKHPPAPAPAPPAREDWPDAESSSSEEDEDLKATAVAHGAAVRRISLSRRLSDDEKERLGEPPPTRSDGAREGRAATDRFWVTRFEGTARPCQRLRLFEFRPP